MEALLRTWRALHYLSFATYAPVTLHGLLAGSDTSMPWMTAVYIGSAAGVDLL